MLVMLELTALDRLSELELALGCLTPSRSTVSDSELSTNITPEPEPEPDTADNRRFLIVCMCEQKIIAFKVFSILVLIQISYEEKALRNSCELLRKRKELHTRS